MRRCPACAAAVADGADWCGQCYLDLRRSEPAPPAPGPDPTRPTEDPRLTAASPPRGRHAAPSPEADRPGDVDLDLDLDLDLEFGLGGEAGSLPALSAGKRVGVMLGGALVVIGVLLGLSWGIGSLL